MNDFEENYPEIAKYWLDQIACEDL